MRIWNEKKHFFKNGVDIPCLATSHTNNRARVNRSQDESSNNNDNRVIWLVLETEEGPLIRCTTARYCRGNTMQRRYHEPCGYWEWHANLQRKINNNAVSSLISKRVSMGWWFLRLSAKILALLRLSVNFFQLRLTKKLILSFFFFQRVKY